jgi:hypothetical protein
MIARQIGNIVAADIRHLVENNVQERKTLEYKAELPDDSDGSKKEFLADISSLANTEGGDLVFGLREIDGTLQDNIGIAILNNDLEIARLENMARDGIFPRINLEIRSINVEDGRNVIIVRTKASLEAPHRVIFKAHDKFYKRNSNGKYPMDVGELRSAFLQSGEVVERIRRFRTARIGDIKAGDTPFPLTQNNYFIAVHIVPLTAFSTGFRLSSSTLSILQRGGYSASFSPFHHGGGWSHRINLDGVVAYRTMNDPIVWSYGQLYRDGRFEGVESSILSDAASERQRRMPMYSVESDTMTYLQQTLGLLAHLEIQPPFYVFVSLVGTKGLTVSPPSQHVAFGYEAITQNELLLPEVVIESTSDNLHHKFRPIFDMIWNAAGVSRSLNFDDQDNLRTHA